MNMKESELNFPKNAAIQAYGTLQKPNVHHPFLRLKIVQQNPHT